MKQKLINSLLLCGLLLFAVMTKSNAQGQGKGQGGDGGESEVQRGFQIAPVPLNLVGKNRSLVGLGSYLVNSASECTGCHTAGLYLEGGNPFVGQAPIVNVSKYLAGGATFGPFISRNLTPDGRGRPAGLTLSEFKTVIRTGADLKALPPHVPGNPGFLQVMPWPAYRDSTDKFIEAIYEYLSAIPCLPGGPEPNSATRCNP
jgi:hypothetical protein